MGGTWCTRKKCETFLTIIKNQWYEEDLPEKYLQTFIYSWNGGSSQSVTSDSLNKNISHLDWLFSWILISKT